MLGGGDVGFLGAGFGSLELLELVRERCFEGERG